MISRVFFTEIISSTANNTGGVRGAPGSGPLTPSQAAAARSSSSSITTKTVLTPKNTTNTSNNAQLTTEDKQKLIVQQKLQSMLLTQKEQLKREIKQKRNSHEREIQSQIKDQMNSIQIQGQGGGGKTVTLTAGQALPQQIVAAAAATTTPTIPTTISKPVQDLMFGTEKENSQQTADIKTTSIPEPIENAPPANLLQNSYEAIASGDLHNNTTTGKKHALKKYNQFTLNTSCFWGSTGLIITPVVKFHEIFVTKK